MKGAQGNNQTAVTSLTQLSALSIENNSLSSAITSLTQPSALSLANNSLSSLLEGNIKWKKFNIKITGLGLQKMNIKWLFHWPVIFLSNYFTYTLTVYKPPR
jgi:hypothetical protein